MIHADQELLCHCMAASWAFCQWHIVIEIDVVPFITLLWDCCSLGGLSRSCSDVSWSRRTVPQCSDLIGYSIVFQDHKRSYSVKSTQYYSSLCHVTKCHKLCDMSQNVTNFVTEHSRNYRNVCICIFLDPRKSQNVSGRFVFDFFHDFTKNPLKILNVHILY